MKLSTIAHIVRELLRRGGEQSQRLDALRQIGRQMVPDYRFTWPDLDWWNSSSFNDYLDATDERDGFNTQRRWMLAQLLRLIHDVPGDTAECGVYRGSTSWLICRANAASPQPRHHCMFDSFEGVSSPTAADGSYWTRGDLATAQQAAETRLSEFTEKTFYKGWIPDRFDDVSDRTFAFVHIDVDLYEPTRDSVAFFYPRLADGGLLLCDDYAFTTCPGATRACDEFLADKPESMISLSPGGGFLIKGVSTGEELFAP